MNDFNANDVYEDNVRKQPRNNKNNMKKYVTTAVAGAVVAIAAAVMVFDGTYQVAEQEQAVVTTFGVAKAVPETGLHFKIPFIQKVE